MNEYAQELAARFDVTIKHRSMLVCPNQDVLEAVLTYISEGGRYGYGVSAGPGSDWRNEVCLHYLTGLSYA